MLNATFKPPWCWSLLVFVVSSGAAGAQDLAEYVRTDPEKIVQPVAEACGQCHRSEFEVWEQTPHAQGFDTLHRKEVAERIAGAMGFRLIKRDSLCLKCHYTALGHERRGRRQLRAETGVSCESCHGAARDWIHVHNDYGVQERDVQKARTLETPEHRARRIEQSKASGMLRPSELYEVVANCFECHTVPHEELVNTGGHGSGSDFELVAWSQGVIRHNFLESFLTGDGTHNAQRPPERKRVMYVVGRALAVEYSLRGVAVARENGRYTKAMVHRANKAIRALKRMADRASIPEVDAMLQAAKAVQVKRNNTGPLLQAAGQIASATRQFIANHDGTQIASIDPLLTGTAPADVSPASSERSPQTETGPTTTNTTSPEPPTDEPPAPGPGQTQADSTRAPVPTETARLPSRTAPRRAPATELRRRPPWRTRPTQTTVGAGECERCHGPQANWWYDDKHFSTADPFLNGERKYLQIARFYGLGESEMTRGDHICMNCHGTIYTGLERSEVDTGVSCESCHGHGGEFLEIHKTDYPQALRLGMVELKDLGVRARTCGGCHLITEQSLLSVGHPSGSDYDFVSGNQSVHHWEEPVEPGADVRSAYSRVLAGRPVPSVALREPPPAPPDSDGSTSPPGVSSTDDETSPTAPVSRGGNSLPGQSPRQAVDGRGTGGAAPSGATNSSSGSDPGGRPSRLTVTDETTVEEMLLLLKQRLENIDRRLKR